MFQRRIYLNTNSYVEVSTRVYNGKEEVMLTIAGPKNETETTSSSAILSEDDTKLLHQCMTEVLERTPSWPPEEQL